MATARLPNPNSGAETHLKAHHITLRESLEHQKDTNTFQRNTDINTFQSRIEAEGGFRTLDETLHKQVAGGSSLAQLSEDVKEGTRKADKDKEFKEGGEGPRAFQALIKPFKKLISTQGGELFSDANFGMERGMERFNSGLKELTNGVGALGPVINAFKTGMYKVIAVVNLLIGGFTMFVAAIGKVLGFIGQIFMGRPDKELSEEEEKELDDNITAAQDEVDKLEKETPFPDVIWARLHPDTMSDIKSIVKNKGNDRTGDKTGKAFKDDVSKAKEDLKERKKSAKENLKTAKDAKKNALSNLAKENAKRFKGLLSQDKKDMIRKKKAALFEKGLIIKKFIFEKAFMILSRIATGLLIVAAIKLAFDAVKDEAIAALARAGKLISEKVISIFTKMRASLGKIAPRIFGKVDVPDADKKGNKKDGKDGKDKKPDADKDGKDKKPDADKKPDKKPKPKARKFLGKLFNKIPGIGAGVETAMDMNEQKNKMNLVTDAFENQKDVIQNEDGSYRPMTQEEYDIAVKANRANMTGSVGKGAGGFGGALAGGATGAAIGSVVPVVGTLIGGVIGSLIGGMFGSRAGDAAATNIAADMQGIDDPQTMIDNLALNAEAASSGNDLENMNNDISDQKFVGGNGSSSSTTFAFADNSSSSETIKITPDSGQDREFGYST